MLFISVGRDIQQIEIGVCFCVFKFGFKSHYYFNFMRQSGVLAKYSAAETADVRLVRFSTFTKEELVNIKPFRKHGLLQK